MVKRRWRRLDVGMRREIMRLAAQGCSYGEIVERLDSSLGTVGRVVRDSGGMARAERWRVSANRLSLEDRIEIQIGLGAGESLRVIGTRIGRVASTVCREVNHNGGRGTYRALAAHEAAHGRALRPKPTKLSSHSRLCARVVEDLEALWSPAQIARRLRTEFPRDPEMWVSHETIYQSLFVQGRGELRRELTRCLRSGRTRRRPQGRTVRGRIPDMVMISERPAEVEDRAVPGHWEGDLILGKNGRSAIGTLVERSTRYVMLMALPEGRAAEQVRAKLTETVQRLPIELWRSLTWDQGIEMVKHREFTVDTGVQVYFCDPHSPWQRGSNENTNGLLRQYFPKGTDLSRYTQDELDAVARQLNGRPRQTLGWMKPYEQLTTLVATTT